MVSVYWNYFLDIDDFNYYFLIYKPKSRILHVYNIYNILLNFAPLRVSLNNLAPLNMLRQLLLPKLYSYMDRWLFLNYHASRLRMFLGLFHYWGPLIMFLAYWLSTLLNMHVFNFFTKSTTLCPNFRTFSPEFCLQF